MSVRHAAFWSIGSQYLSFAIQFIVSVLISRYFLAPAEVGLFSIALAGAMMVSILQDFGLTRYIAGHPTLDRAMLSSCMLVAILFSWLVAGVIMGAAWPIASFYHDARLAPMMLVIGASYLLAPCSIVPVSVAMHGMDFRTVFLVNVVGALVGGITSLTLAYHGMSAMALAWGTVATAAARGVTAIACQPVPLPWPLRTKGIRKIVTFGSQSSLLFISGAIGSRSADLVIGRVLSLTAVGLFSRATSLASQLRALVSGAIGGVFYPAFARIRDTGEPLAPHYLRVVAGFTAITWPAMAALALASSPIVQMLYGPQWAGVAPVLQWIAVGEIMFVAVPLHIEIPILLDRIRTLIRFNVVDTVMSIALLLAAAHVGLHWAAASRAVYALAWATMYLFLLHRLLRFDVKALFDIYLRSAIGTGAALMPLAAYMQWNAKAEMGFGALLGCTVAGAILWLVVLHLIRHPAIALIDKELVALRRILLRDRSAGAAV